MSRKTVVTLGIFGVCVASLFLGLSINSAQHNDMALAILQVVASLVWSGFVIALSWSYRR